MYLNCNKPKIISECDNYTNMYSSRSQNMESEYTWI